MAQPTYPLPQSPDAPTAHHLGDLARSDQRWSVYLETRPHGRRVTGRLHFVHDQERLATAWIFLEATEADIAARFNDFSPVELWRLVASLQA